MKSLVVLVIVTIFCISVYADAQPKKKPKTDSTKKSVREKKTRKDKDKSSVDTVATEVFEFKRQYPPPGSAGQGKNFDFVLKRAPETGYIDPDIYFAAIEKAKKMPVYSRHGKSPHPLAVTDEWKSVGPYGIGGRISALAMHPSDKNIFYAGAAAGGVWKTTDRGESWKALTDTFTTLPTGALAIDPKAPNTIYYGQGESNNSADSYPGQGIWRSDDGGDTWKQIGLVATQYIQKIIIDSANTNRLFVCAPGPRTASDSNRGIFRSLDRGETWERVLLVRTGTSRTARPAVPTDLVMNPTNPQELIACLWDKGSGSFTSNGPYTGLWLTVDGGDTWSRIDTGKTTYPNALADKRFARGALAWVDSGDHTVLYSLLTKVDTNIVTGHTTDENFYGLFKTTNPTGDEWVKCIDSSYKIPYFGNYVDSVDVFYRQGGYNNFLDVNPYRPNEIYVGGIDILRSTNYGETFEDITNSYPHYFTNNRDQHSDQHAMGFTADPSGTDLFVGNDGGVFHTINFGANWRQLKGLPITMFYHVEAIASAMTHLGGTFQPDSLVLMGGTQDNGTVSTRITADNDWKWINRGDGGWSVSHPTDKEKLITSLQLGKIFVRNTLDSIQPNLRTDGGNSTNPKRWYEISRNLLFGDDRLTDTTESVAFIPDIRLDTVSKSELYTGRLRVYRAKIDWQDPTKTTWSTWSPQIMGTNGKLSTWYTGYVNSLALGVRDKNGRPMLWAGGITYNGFSYSTSLWRTTVDPSIPLDSAPQWTRISSGLPVAYVSCIVPDRSDSLTAFCSLTSPTHSLRIAKTVDGGKKWTSVTSDDLPQTTINSIIVNEDAEHGDPNLKNQCIIAATDIGVFVSVNGGKNWSKLGSGLPTLVVNHITKYKNYLIASTHGRGAWVLDISDMQAEPPSSVEYVSDPISSLQIVSVFPNPAAKDGFNVHVKTGSTTNNGLLFELLAAESGTVLYSLSTNSVSEETTYRLILPQGISSGSYLLRVYDNEGNSAIRQVVITK